MDSFLFALSHLSRLPVPAVPFKEESLGRSTAFFPLVGLLFGLILAVFWWLAGWLFPPPVIAAMIVVGLVALTGGIHLDGFMDSVDGLFSGRPRERKLEIMRDSRVGAFGVLALTCLLLLKFALLQGLLEGLFAGVLFKMLLLIPVLSRWGMTFAIFTFPYARPEGLGKLHTIYTGRKELLLATLTAAVVAGFILGPVGLWLMALGGALTLLLGKAVAVELGGLTGDVYGAINEVLEVMLLLAFYVVLRVSSSIL